MYDIKSIALELNVTVQTVYNHLKKNNKEIKPHIFKRKGTTYIDNEGLIIIQKSMGLIEVPTVQEDVSLENIIENISTQVSTSIKSELLNDLNSLILERQKQLNEQFEEKLEKFKNEILMKQQEQIQAENSKLKDYITTTREQEKKKGLFSRFLNK